jgi:purine-binding chemotaxis protein CheW
MAAGTPQSENSAVSTSADEGHVRQHRLVYRAGAQLCAVPLDCVVEVMRALPVKPVSGGPPYVCGVCIIRGEPVAVVDTGVLVGNRPTAFERLITVRTGSGTVALAAEAVLGICAIGAEKLSQLPPLLRGAAAETIAAIGTLDAELLFVLRTALIVPEGLFDRLLADGAQS